MDRKVKTFTRSYLAALTGVQLMYVVFFAFGSVPRNPGDTGRFTSLGAELYRPERELPIYLLAILVTVTVSLVVERFYRGSHRPAVSQSAGQGLCPLSLMKCLIATCGAICFIAACAVLPGQSGSPSRLTMIGALMLLCMSAISWMMILIVTLRPLAPPRLSRLINAGLGEPAASNRASEAGRWGIADLLIIAVLIAIVYIPNVERLASADFQMQQLHHWDYYVMGPSIGYLHGEALGSEAYAQYGVGYPMLAAALARCVPLTYPNLMRLGIVIGCLYYAGLYGFLRSLLRNRAWALFGALLAINLQLFHGVEPHFVIWQYPSSTPMRSPCDVWLFALLVLDARSRSRLPLAGASVLVGLAVLVETDTGAYLGFALAVYFLLSRRKHASLQRGRLLPNFAAAALPAAVVTVTGLAIASRGHLLSVQFLKGWLEVYSLYPSGVGMLPIFQSTFGVVISFAFIVTYLAVVLYHVNVWCRNGLTNRGAVLASVAVFGLCYLCQFIGRSHPDNLFHCSVSIIVLATVFGKAVVEVVLLSTKHSQRQASIIRAAPAIFTTLVIVNAVSASGFQDYPNVFHPAAEGAGSTRLGFALRGTGIRLPSGQGGFAVDFNLAAVDAAGIQRAGHTVFFLVDNDPIYYLASGTMSRFRYSPLMQCLLTRSAQRQFEKQFTLERIDYVYAPTVEASGIYGDATHDVRQSLMQVVHSNYRIDHRCGQFEVWRHQ